MADGVVIPATGTGTATPTVATDDIAGIHYQRVKLTNGVADDATFINSGVGTPVNALRTVEATATTPGQTSVAGSATSVTVLASNANRLGATVFNDSTAILYLKLGATASTTSFTIKMAAGGYYEVPFRYTGIIDGIWASAAGSARVTELSA